MGQPIGSRSCARDAKQGVIEMHIPTQVTSTKAASLKDTPRADPIFSSATDTTARRAHSWAWYSLGYSLVSTREYIYTRLLPPSTSTSSSADKQSIALGHTYKCFFFNSLKSSDSAPSVFWDRTNGCCWGQQLTNFTALVNSPGPFRTGGPPCLHAHIMAGQAPTYWSKVLSIKLGRAQPRDLNGTARRANARGPTGSRRAEKCVYVRTCRTCSSPLERLSDLALIFPHFRPHAQSTPALDR